MLYKVSGGAKQLLPHSGQVISPFCGSDGDTWLAASTGVWNIHADRFTALPPIPGMAPFALKQVIATPDHVLFAGVSGAPDNSGVWRYAGGAWAKLAGPGVLPRTPGTEYLDSHGRLWVGYEPGVIGLPLEGGGKMLPSGVGAVHAILETTHGLFAGGMNGLAVLRDNRFETLPFADRLSAQGVGGIVESGNGDLWLNAAHGIVHVRSEDLETALHDPLLSLKSELLTEGDFVGPADLSSGLTTTGRDADGNLWFATMSGVFHIDPGHLNSGIHPPILSIRSISVDQIPVSDSGTIAPGPPTLDIQYLGVNLTTPERVIYRHRLDGLDNGWQDAGHRTEAIYTHLRPGTYTFRVMASNGDGVWTAALSSASFRVLPYFYQTTWFLLLCGLAGLILLWFIYALRIRSVTRAVRARAEERADERVRIARDLHDTLLQSVHGLLLTFHVIAQKVAPDHDSRAMLERALSSADEVIVEGRNRVSDLRSERVADAQLVGALENVGKNLMHETQIELRVRRDGIDAALYDHIADEVFYIAREAITNTFRHSGASEISVELTYGRRRFSLLCRDNGCGFSAEDEEKSGHWGLKGMRERALKLGGELRCESEPTRGTQIFLTAPASRAYERDLRFALLVRPLRRFGQNRRKP